MAKSPTSTKIVSKKHLARLERERIQNKYIVTAAIAVIVIVVLLIGYGVLDQNVLAYNRPVAKVGDSVITVRDFQTTVRWTRYQLIQQYQQTAQLAQMFGSDESSASYFQNSLTQIQSQLDGTETMGSEVLDNLITNELIRQEAARRGITVTKEEVDQSLEASFGFFPNGTPTPEVVPTGLPTSTLSPGQLTLVPPTATATVTPTAAPTDTATPGAPTATTEPTSATPATTATITPSATPYTEEGFQGQKTEFLDRLKDINADEAFLRSLLENNLYYTKVRDAITADIAREQDQVWARHILVADENVAKTTLEQIRDGADFVALAAELSIDASNKDNGGDLGWFGPGKMVKEFEDAAYALEVGEISEPVKTSNGYHIIQLLGHEVRSLTSEEYEQAKDTKFQEWITTELAKDTIKKYDTWKTNVPTDPSLGDTPS